MTSARRTRLSSIVAIPVRNECERIGACLEALTQQRDVSGDAYGILLFLNNCTDGTNTIVAGFAAQSDRSIRVLEQDYPHATAGWARRMAMEAASSWLDDEGANDGIILTTDADSRVAPNWIAANLAYLERGADAVAGTLVLDPDDAARLPAALHERGRLEAEYEALLTEIDARVDPDPANPWPCHWTASGASLAVRQSIYNAVGGMPALALGEDRAFVEALRAVGARIRQTPDIVVVTSGRLDGRAVGGVSETMKFRCENLDCLCDGRLEPVRLATKRAAWRRRLRTIHAAGHLEDIGTWAPLLGVDPNSAQRAMSHSAFSKAFAAIVDASPALASSPRRPSELPFQIRLARLVLRSLRLHRHLSRSEHPIDIDPSDIDRRFENMLRLYR